LGNKILDKKTKTGNKKLVRLLVIISIRFSKGEHFGRAIGKNNSPCHFYQLLQMKSK